MSAISAALGACSMMFTPKGLSVSSRHLRISFRTASVPKFIDEMRPRPPASETAAARRASAIHAMPPWNRGWRMPSISQILLFIIDIIWFQYSVRADLRSGLPHILQNYPKFYFRQNIRCLACRGRSSPSGSKNHRAALYCLQDDFLGSNSTEIRFGGSATRSLMQAQLQRCSTSISFRLAASLVRFASKSP